MLCVLLLCVFSLGLLGCGGSESNAPSAAQLEKAREEGEREGQERARVDELEEEVQALKRKTRQDKATPSPAVGSPTPAPVEQREPETELLRSFHAPSGNVSCAITSNGAYCTVASIATTFRLTVGSPGQIEPGAVLPKGFGELADWESTVSAGSITCTVPASNEPRGIVCSDVSSGHGFEASRVSARQKAY